MTIGSSGSLPWAASKPHRHAAQEDALEDDTLPNDAGTESDTKTPDDAPTEYAVIPGSESHAPDEINAPEKAEQSYTIKDGDNRSDLAQEQLGDANRWKEIYELNKDVIGDNPDMIHPGQKLTLPEEHRDDGTIAM